MRTIAKSFVTQPTAHRYIEASVSSQRIQKGPGRGCACFLVGEMRGWPSAAAVGPPRAPKHKPVLKREARGEMGSRAGLAHWGAGSVVLFGSPGRGGGVWGEVLCFVGVLWECACCIRRERAPRVIKMEGGEGGQIQATSERVGGEAAARRQREGEGAGNGGAAAATRGRGRKQLRLAGRRWPKGGTVVVRRRARAKSKSARARRLFCVAACLWLWCRVPAGARHCCDAGGQHRTGERGGAKV